MKKKIVILLMTLVMPITALADTTIWSEDVKSDLELINSEMRYRYYLPVKKGEYVLRGIKDTKYLYEDESDIKYSDFNDELDACLKEIPSYIDTEIVKLYTYINVSKIRYLKIDSLDENKEFIIKVFDDEEEIETSINDESGYNIIDLNGEYAVKRLTLISSGVKSITFLAEEHDSVFEIPIIEDGKVVIEEYLKKNYHNYDFTTTEQTTINDDSIVLKEEELCKKRRVYTYRYNIEKLYYGNNYYKELSIDGYLPDMESGKEYYEYFVLDDEKRENSDTKDEILFLREQAEEVNEHNTQIDSEKGSNKKAPSKKTSFDITQSQIRIKRKIITYILTSGLCSIFCLGSIIYFLCKKRGKNN